jgi:integrase
MKRPTTSKPNDLVIINNWLSQFAPKTAHGYLTDIALFRDFVECPLKAVTKEAIEQFINHADCPSIFIRNRRISAINGLFRFAYENRYLDHNPTIQAVINAIDRWRDKPPVVLGEKDVLRLLRSCQTDRDYIIIALAYYTALTSSELGGLTWNNIKSHAVHVTTGATARSVHIPEHLWQRIMRYRDTVHRRDDDPIFLSRLRGALSTRQINRVINEVSVAAGIPGIPANTRILRASHAQHAFSHGAGIEAVREIMHHTTAKSTVRYRVAARNVQQVRTGDLLPHGKVAHRDKE